MMNRSPVVLLVLALGLPALAEEESGMYQTRLLPPGAWDLHGGVLLDGLLRDWGLSLAADYGWMQAGPGNLSLGFELSGGACLLGCSVFAGSGATWEDGVGLARVTYHLPISGETPNISGSDVYGLAMAGAAVVVQHAQSETTASVGPAVGLGVGSIYFPGNGDKLFAGGELRILFAQSFGVTPGWYLTGVSFRLTMGARL